MTTQEVYLLAIDRFSDAVAALAKHATKTEIRELQDATGDLLEAVAERATQQSLSAWQSLQAKIHEIEQEQAAAAILIDELQQQRSLEAGGDG